MTTTTALSVIRFWSVCAWCRALQRIGTPNAPVSHTICPACAERLKNG